MLAILKGEPWSFDKRLMVMKQVTGAEQLSTTPITDCAFRIKVYDIPFRLRADSFVAEVGNRLGSFIATDERGVIGWGSFLRIRVLIDVTQPLKKEVLCQVRDQPILSFRISYEKLPNFCYACGRIGHLVKECDEFSDIDSEEESELPFNETLRAAPKKPFSLSTRLPSPKKPPSGHSRQPKVLKHATVSPVVQDTLVQEVHGTLNLTPHTPQPVSSPPIPVPSTNSPPI
ncbi:hypothetical protein Tsubulata_031093 [Turnera subulata]|uniref:CCHC-type domain-containing protein n=1 Tax=Turnera subulata TaxID=218843 RepID=A0A9Q0FHR7_9ROSI|nr:hypothetical protein Tsubulata_031093 [Turnera subulata]